MPKSEEKHLKTDQNTSQKKRIVNPLEILKIFHRKTHSYGISAVPFNRGFIVRAAHATNLSCCVLFFCIRPSKIIMTKKSYVKSH